MKFRPSCEISGAIAWHSRNPAGRRNDLRPRFSPASALRRKLNAAGAAGVETGAGELGIHQGINHAGFAKSIGRERQPRAGWGQGSARIRGRRHKSRHNSHGSSQFSVLGGMVRVLCGGESGKLAKGYNSALTELLTHVKLMLEDIYIRSIDLVRRRQQRHIVQPAHKAARVPSGRNFVGANLREPLVFLLIVWTRSRIRSKNPRVRFETLRSDGSKGTISAANSGGNAHPLFGTQVCRSRRVEDQVLLAF